MKILHKTLVLGAFLLISSNAFGQDQLVDSEKSISIVNASTSASVVIEFQFSEPKEIDLIVFDLNEVVVLKTSWKNIESAFKKLDFSELKIGEYTVRFFDHTNLIFEKKVSKI